MHYSVPSVGTCGTQRPWLGMTVGGVGALPQREHFELSWVPVLGWLWLRAPLFLGCRIFSTNTSFFVLPLRICCCSCTASRWRVNVFVVSRVNLGSSCIRSDRALSRIPTTIRSRIISSLMVPYSQLSARP